MPKPGSEISRAAKDGYHKAAKTMLCQSCSKIRSIENIKQFTPRIKCKECCERSEAFKRARRSE